MNQEAETAAAEIAHLSLMGDFPEPSRQAWLEIVEQTLRGKPFEGTLTTTTLDGIELQPLYEVSAADGSLERKALSGRADANAHDAKINNSKRQWELRAFCDASSASSATVAAEVEGGADCIFLDLGASDVHLEPAKLLQLKELLSGLGFSSTAIAIEAGTSWHQAAQALSQVGEQLLPNGTSFQGSFRADPIASLAREGTMTMGQGSVADLVVAKAEVFSAMRTVGVDASVFADAGASEAQELGLSLAAGVWYLRELTSRGISIDDACAELEFTYVGSADIFATIAKLRAARFCWRRVAEAAGASAVACRQYQHVISSKTMLARHDPTVNVLRTTAAAFAAATAGADAICVLPHDFFMPKKFAVVSSSDSAPSTESNSTGDAQRLARNISHILLEEVHLAHVGDPTGGSGYVEELTTAIAHKAWDLFQQVEAEGGIVAVLETGAVSEWLAETWQKRLEDIRHRRQPICGVSEFPDLAEMKNGTRTKNGTGTGVELDADLSNSAATTPAIQTTLVLRRFAEPFERLRDRSDQLTWQTGQVPTVFLAVLGTLAQASPRIGFAENLLAAGGILAVVGSGESSQAKDQATDEWQAKLAADFKASGAHSAVLCSSDEVYENQASAAVESLTGAGCEGVYLAGRIRGNRLSQVPLDGSLYAGCDVVSFLDGLLSCFEQSAEV